MNIIMLKFHSLKNVQFFVLSAVYHDSTSEYIVLAKFSYIEYKNQDTCIISIIYRRMINMNIDSR